MLPILRSLTIASILFLPNSGQGQTSGSVKDKAESTTPRNGSTEKSLRSEKLTEETKPTPPATPRKYLETGALLFNQHRFDLAWRYLEAAQMYREQLTPGERIVLEVYREKITNHLTRTTSSTPERPIGEALSPRSDTAVRVASQSSNNSPGFHSESLGIRSREEMPQERRDSIGEDFPIRNYTKLSDIQQPQKEDRDQVLLPSSGWRDTIDSKQKARWLLQIAREQIIKKHFELAEQAILEASTINVNWTLFDETPDILKAALLEAKAKEASRRMQVSAGAEANSMIRHDRATAKMKLKEGRVALARREFEAAERVALEVQSWSVSFGLFDDTPDKLLAAVRAARSHGSR